MNPEGINAIAAYIVAIVAFMGVLISIFQSHEAKKAITNKHPRHIRDDIDKNQGEVITRLEELLGRFDTLEKREMITLERIGKLEAHKNSEHDNIWRAIAGLRKKEK